MVARRLPLLANLMILLPLVGSPFGARAAGLTQPWPAGLTPPAAATHVAPSRETDAGPIVNMMLGSGAIETPATPALQASQAQASAPHAGRLKTVASFLACVRHAAALQHVPPGVVLGIIRTESGWNGASIRNTNGSHDLGIMQVNGRTWVQVLAREEFGETTASADAVIRQMLRYDDCFNINVGTWIFGMYLDQAAGNVILAVGWYNSHDPVSMHAYQRRFRASFLDLFGAKLQGSRSHGQG